LSSKLTDNVEYIDYSYWNELSLNSRKPLIAAKNINENKLEGVKLIDKFIDFSKQIKDQKVVDPIILVSDYKKQVILEGHSRITAMSLLDPQDLDFEVTVIIGYSEKISDWVCF
jgi:hypothetical protein